MAWKRSDGTGEIGMERDGQLARGKRGGWISRGKERSSQTSPRERVQESVGHDTTSRGTYSRLSTSKLPLTAADTVDVCALSVCTRPP